MAENDFTLSLEKGNTATAEVPTLTLGNEEAPQETAPSMLMKVC